MKVLEKKVPLEELKSILESEKKIGKKVALCLGVFDLVHPGHIRHFQEAKSKSDILVVAITANKYVNKGPDRPVFDEKMRIDSVAAIGCVDYVILNDHPDGIQTILDVAPDFYVKGVEYKKHQDDITGKIKEEANAVKQVNGEILYTDDVVFSSSKLLNTYFRDGSDKFQQFIKNFKKNHSYNEISEIIDRFTALKVLVIGDAIIDQYVYVEPMGVSGKGTHLVARNHHVETYLGGSFVVANHIASFSPNTTLITAVGDQSINIESRLNKSIKKTLVTLENTETLIKRRYVQKDGASLTKFFETYSNKGNSLTHSQTDFLVDYLEKEGDNFDLVLVCDFGNGFINPTLNKAISNLSTFLAINTQINSGNRGYHVVTKYDRADYISLNEPELRLTTHDLTTDLKLLVEDVCKNMSCKNMSTTRGVKGVSIYNKLQGHLKIPALTQKVVDRVGAGDSYLALSSLALAVNENIEIAGFLGSAAAALDVQIIGNKKCIEKIPFLKYITTLLK